MLQPSTLSMAARGLRVHLAQAGGLDEADIGFGHPAAPLFAGTDPGVPSLSIFFYKAFSAGNNSDDHPGRPLDVIVHCILTPLSKKTANGENGISPGEKDLRMLGRIMQCMHQNPRFNIIDEDQDDKPVCEVEIIPIDLSTEELNKIVPSPPEGGFRSTVAYALTLLPIPLDALPSEGPLVDIVTYSISPSADRSKPMLLADSSTLTQRLIEKPVFGDPWRPHLFLLDDRGYPGYALQVVTGKDTEKVCLLAAGPANAAEKGVQLIKIMWSPFSRQKASEEIIETTIKTSAVTPSENYSELGFWVPLETGFSCQYLLRLRRTESDGTAVVGNACLVTVVRKEGG